MWAMRKRASGAGKQQRCAGLAHCTAVTNAGSRAGRHGSTVQDTMWLSIIQSSRSCARSAVRVHAIGGTQNAGAGMAGNSCVLTSMSLMPGERAITPNTAPR